MSPRCGRPMTLDGRCERSGVPVLEDPVCGRRDNHPPPCRSEAAMARYRLADIIRWQDRGRWQRDARRQAARSAA